MTCLVYLDPIQSSRPSSPAGGNFRKMFRLKLLIWLFELLSSVRLRALAAAWPALREAERDQLYGQVVCYARRVSREWRYAPPWDYVLVIGSFEECST